MLAAVQGADRRKAARRASAAALPSRRTPSAPRAAPAPAAPRQAWRAASTLRGPVDAAGSCRRCGVLSTLRRRVSAPPCQGLARRVRAPPCQGLARRVRAPPCQGLARRVSAPPCQGLARRVRAAASCQECRWNVPPAALCAPWRCSGLLGHRPPRAGPSPVADPPAPGLASLGPAGLEPAGLEPGLGPAGLEPGLGPDVVVPVPGPLAPESPVAEPGGE